MNREQERPEFWAAYDCGHDTRLTTDPPRGIAWCPMCRGFVGVIVQRADRPAALPGTGIRTTE